MLVHLSIRNLAVVEAVDVSFYSGFHVLTGETGAGKSIIIDALGFIAGGRGSADLIRYGCDKAEIEASFDLKNGHPVWQTLANLGIGGNASESLIIRREISAQGKSTSRINGQLVNLTMLREVGDQLINIHGQHEHQTLLRPERHLHLLDAFGSHELAPLKKAYQEIYADFVKVEKEWNEIQKSSRQTFQMLDMYRYQLDEIAAAQLISGEDELLSGEKVKLSHSEKMLGSISDAYELMNGAQGLETIAKAISRFEEVASYDSTGIQPILDQLQSAYFQLEDASFAIRNYRESIEVNPDRLGEVEDRLNLINTLRRKYGESIDRILAYYEQIRLETDTLENKDEIMDKLKVKRETLLQKLLKQGEQLSAARQRCADDLALQMESELRDLQMGRTSLKVKLGRMEDPTGVEWKGKRIRVGKQGLDTAEFLISPNPGEPLRPLSKIASGGELSRMMLALKSIFSQHDEVPVLIFDEVDTGVSGRAAQSIADKLYKLSESCQIFSITHLPQVACMADRQYLIEKVVSDGRTMTLVESLSDEGRIVELARMLGGVEITEKTLHHAQEMLGLAAAQKA
ncbi:DNA repair protein RecN (Recombination protein N) [Paenibacillus shirakamiensis]|uniref:DNA repair protein RecN n=1 Tax=Paenibacillus shirakamiensis TaxID=1265935 RepID=A0ABS4JEQ9_9BACL|nr:DNA repair protein RecN [Paenibacillus shirakamiensis]MBP1999451.1 DNA repair protein RecN (Recombination protein N) [Paenibacillus shirakamiensis]